MGSSLVDNTLRGSLAEYLVALDCGVADEGREEWREEWREYDLETPEGVKIEVKCSAYIQSWYQRAESKPQFDIASSLGWNPQTNESGKTRECHADAHVFCLHKHRDQNSIDPLDVSQWSFFVLATAVLERELPEQKKIGLSSLLKLGAREVSFGGIYPTIQTLLRHPRG